MGSYPPPPFTPPPGYDPRAHRRAMREQARAQRDYSRAQAQQVRYQMRALRRTSILGPVLLIGLGVVFLLVQVGRLPSAEVWAWFGQWWPAILVGSGLVLLAEWMWDQYRLRDGAELPYRRSAGGLVFTLLFLIAFGGFAEQQVRMHMNGDHWWYGLHIDPDQIDQFLGDKHESDQTVDLAFPAGAALSVSDPRGDVTVSGTSEDGRIHIAVHKQVYSRSDSEAETKAERLSPLTTTADGVMSVRLPQVEGGRSDLVISTPPGAAATVSSNHGDIHIATMKGAVTVTANHGDVDVSGVTGQAIVHINGGGSSLSARSLGSGLTVEGHADDLTLSEITGPVSISGEYFGTTHMEHIAGTIHFRTSRTDLQMARLDGETEISPHMDLRADQVQGPLVLTTSNRNITLDRVAGNVSVTNRNGSIDLTVAPALGAILLADRNGSIKTVLPEASSFVVQASTTDGDISTNFPVSSEQTGSRKQLNGTVGAGGPVVRITTTNGDISLNKGDVLPLPPMPPAPPRLSAEPAAAAGEAGAGRAKRHSPAKPVAPVAPSGPGSPGA